MATTNRRQQLRRGLAASNPDEAPLDGEQYWESDEENLRAPGDGTTERQDLDVGIMRKTAELLEESAILLGDDHQNKVKTRPGLRTNGTSVVIVGEEGVSAGGIDFENTTSGKVQLRVATGALGTKTAMLPARDGQISVGGLFDGRAAKAAAYTVVAADRGFVIDATTGTWSLGITAAATLGDGFAFGVFNSGSGVITIDANSTETIRDFAGSATTKALAQGESGILYCDGAGFFLMRIAAAPTTATTQAAGNNSTSLATTEYVDQAVSIAQYQVNSGNYTLVLADQFKAQKMTSASANALTIPPNSSVAMPVGIRIPGQTLGAGQTTITPGSGVTLRGRGAAYKSAGQYAAWLLEQIATDEWLVTGDLTA